MTAILIEIAVAGYSIPRTVRNKSTAGHFTHIAGCKVGLRRVEAEIDIYEIYSWIIMFQIKTLEIAKSPSRLSRR